VILTQGSITQSDSMLEEASCELDRKVEKIAAQLIRRIQDRPLTEPSAELEALHKVEDRARDYLEYAAQIDLNTPAFQSSSISHLGRAAAILARQAERVSSRSTLSSSADELLSRAADLARQHFETSA
jgi:hypothetical protein